MATIADLLATNFPDPENVWTQFWASERAAGRVAYEDTVAFYVGETGASSFADALHAAATEGGLGEPPEPAVVEFIGAGTPDLEIEWSAAMTPTPHANTQVGDLLVLVVIAATPTMTGWTTVANPLASGSTRANVFIKFAETADLTSVTVPGEGAGAGGKGCILYSFRGVDTDTPQDATATTATGATASSVSPVLCPDITTVTDGAMVVVVGGVANDGTAAAISDGFTLAGQLSTTLGNDVSGSAGYQLVATAGAVTGGDVSGNWASGAWAAVTFALRPAA